MSEGDKTLSELLAFDITLIRVVEFIEANRMVEILSEQNLAEADQNVLEYLCFDVIW